jgi:rSAM/selenodomain-associated transferase 1
MNTVRPPAAKPKRGDAPHGAAGPMPWRLIVMAKAPAAGLAKTRLIPALGADGAAALAARLLAHAIEQAEAAAPAAREMCVTPDPAHPAFAAWAGRPGWQWSAQGAGDLGARMDRALTRALAAAPAALLIGTDAPALDAARLCEAAQALREYDTVFVPALDGGYALVGLRRPVPALFDGVAWSTPAVMAATRERAAAAGLRWAELAPVADIDEPADLARLPASWRRG